VITSNTVDYFHNLLRLVWQKTLSTTTTRTMPPKRAANARAIQTTKRCKEGYQRHNGRWEARYRPQSRFELKPDKLTTPAFKGYRKGLYKYEFLE